jgi:EmrB/QacA subfamily drug resistance transporter
MNGVDGPGRRRALLAASLPALVAGAFFMENLDATVLATAVPQMAHSFGVAPARLSVGVSAYMLALAVFIPLSGWFADRFGARRVFGSAIALFTLSSVLCALSTGLGTFTAARLLQGFGGALMVPVGRLVVLRDCAPAERVRAIATITWPGLVAPIIGPPIGGFIASYASWHWIFLLNVPLGLLALALSWLLIRDGECSRRPFDVPGFLLSAGGCCAVMAGLELAGRPPLDGETVAAALAAGVLLLVWAVRHLSRARAPLLELAALSIPWFSVAAIGGSLFRIAIGSAPFLLPLLFQLGFGMSALTSGSLLLSLFAGNLAMKPATTWIMRRFGLRSVLLVNGVLVAAGFAMCAALTADTPAWVIVAVLFFGGLCRSMQLTTLTTAAFSAIPATGMSGASTLFSMFQQMNAGMGVAFAALALRVAEVVTGHAAGRPTVGDFRLAFVMAAALALLGCVDCARGRTQARPSG